MLCKNAFPMRNGCYKIYSTFPALLHYIETGNYNIVLNQILIVMAENKEDLSTMVSILNKLTHEGYTTQFKAYGNGLMSVETNRLYTPQEVEITHFYRFEGESSADDSSVVYAIETIGGEKGTLVDSYGPYSDPLVAKFIKEVESIKK